VSCLNERGAESYRAVTYLDGAVEGKGDLYFLGFGVSKYRDASLNLQYSDKDARDLAATFGRMEGYGKVHTKLYLNEEVTPEAIAGAKSFVSGAKPEDTFVLFIAGHGVHDEDAEATYYFLTHGADLANLAGTAANFESIEELLQGIAPRKKLFLMDTCESGDKEESVATGYLAVAQSRGIKARTTRGIAVKAAGAASGTAPEPPRTYLADRSRYIYNDLARRSGAIVFSSCRGGEFSYESEAAGNGFFTKEILNALGGKVVTETGQVSVDGLRSYVSKAVAERSGDLQHPTVDRDNLYQKFGFPVAK